MTHSLPSLPPLDGLLAVLAAARGGSFTAAAAELRLTHSAISRRVAAVEEWLGSALFERRGRGVALTPEGQRFAHTIEQAFDAIQRAAEQWRPDRRSETLRMSVVPSFAKLWVLPQIRRLQGEPADLAIDLVVEHRLADVARGEVDLAIRFGAGSWPKVTSSLLFREMLVPAGAPELGAHLGAAPPARTLLAHPLLHDSTASAWRAWLAGAGVSYRPRPIDRRFEDYDLVLAAAEAGLGIALLREPLASAWIAAGRLARLSARAIPNPAAHFVVTRAGDQRPALHRLVARLRATAQRSAQVRRLGLAKAGDSVP